MGWRGAHELPVKDNHRDGQVMISCDAQSNINLLVHQCLEIEQNLSKSMGCEICDKYHKCCIENGLNFNKAKLSEFFIFNATLVVFIPNFTAIHIIFPVNAILGHTI